MFQDVDDFFEHEKTFLLEYHNRVKDASAKSDRMIRSHKSKNQSITHRQFEAVAAGLMGNWTILTECLIHGVFRRCR